MTPIAQGYVLSVGVASFWARLQLKGQTVDVEIDRKRLPPREWPFLTEGAYCSLLKGGTVRFSRQRWTRSELKRARRRAKQLLCDVFTSTNSSAKS